MGDILEWLGGFGAGAIQLAIAIGSFVGAVAAGAYAMKLTRKTWVAWGAGIATLVIIIIVMAPAYEALKHVSCRTADSYDACMNDDSDDG